MSRLRGRSEPMARALSVVRDARLSGASAVVMVSGPAGIGKTALLSEVCRQAGAMRVRVAGSKCDPIEQVWPGAPVIALLRSGPDPLTTSAEYERITRTIGEPLLLADRIAAVLETAAVAGPVLIAIDDVQWADRISRFLLRTLISQLIGLPVVWLLSGRDNDVDVLPGHDAVRVERVALAPLGSRDLTAMAHDRLGREPDERTRRFLDAVDGNPFLAVQVIDSAAQGSVPAGFTAAIAQRLAGLSGQARDLVELVAVAGRPLPLADIAALRPEESGSGLAGAIGSGLLTEGEYTLTFGHDLVREAVYASVANGQARELHRKFAGYYLADAGDPFIAASHARAAATAGDLASARILISAAETLADVSAEDAGELAMLAFRTVRPDQPEWLELSRRCLSVLCRIQRATDAIMVADLILARVDDGGEIGRIESEAARALWLGGRISELKARTERVLRLDTVDPAVSARLNAARALADTRLVTGDEATQQAATALERARSTGDREALALALQAAGEAARNEGHHLVALGHFRELRSLTGTSHLADEITALQFLDRYDHAQVLLDEARADSRANTQSILPALHAAQLWQDFYLGRFDDAKTGARTLVELGQQLGDGMYALDAGIVRISLALLRGDVEGAAAHLQVAERLTGADEVFRRPGLIAMRGWLAASRGDLSGAVATLRPVLQGASRTCGYWPLWPCWMGLFFEIGVCAADNGFIELAVDAAEQAAERTPGVASFEGVALNVRGRTKQDLDMIAHSAEVLARSPRAILRAFGADSYGRALLAAGNRSAGLDQLDLAWDEYHGMDARAYRAGVQRAMRDAGARRDKWAEAAARPSSGWASLTEGEQRVARLIAAGRTNKAAASELGVSVNTIATHLRSVFAKLGVQSRVQLVNELNRELAVGMPNVNR